MHVQNRIPLPPSLVCPAQRNKHSSNTPTTTPHVPTSQILQPYPITMSSFHYLHLDDAILPTFSHNPKITIVYRHNINTIYSISGVVMVVMMRNVDTHCLGGNQGKAFSSSFQVW